MMATCTYTDATGDHRLDNPANWVGGIILSEGDDVVLDVRHGEPMYAGEPWPKVAINRITVLVPDARGDFTFPCNPSGLVKSEIPVFSHTTEE